MAEKCPDCVGSGKVGYEEIMGSSYTGRRGTKVCGRCKGSGRVEKYMGTDALDRPCTYERPGCFPAGTRIETPRGVVDIASAKEGDIVLAFDRSRNMLRSRRIIKVCKYGKNTIWEIVFTDGKRIRTTASHSFCVGHIWRQARQIVATDYLCCLDASGRIATRQVAMSSSTTELEEVFNLIVDGDFSFVADGLVAHSFSYFRALRILGWSVYSMIQDWIRAARHIAATHPPNFGCPHRPKSRTAAGTTTCWATSPPIWCGWTSWWPPIAWTR